jgi:hypothetical protein
MFKRLGYYQSGAEQADSDDAGRDDDGRHHDGQQLLDRVEVGPGKNVARVKYDQYFSS